MHFYERVTFPCAKYSTRRYLRAETMACGPRVSWSSLYFERTVFCRALLAFRKGANEHPLPSPLPSLRPVSAPEFSVKYERVARSDRNQSWRRMYIRKKIEIFERTGMLCGCHTRWLAFAISNRWNLRRLFILRLLAWIFLCHFLICTRLTSMNHARVTN